jgi:hypothetical protein
LLKLAAYRESLKLAAPGPVVPSAWNGDQAALEWRVLAAVAKTVGAHDSARFGGAAYGIRASSPTLTGLIVRLDAQVVPLFVDAVLPRRLPSGDVVGVPGVRFAIERRRRVRLFRPRKACHIVLTNAVGWRRAVEDVASTAERDAIRVFTADQYLPWEWEDWRMEHDRGQVPWRWSTALRRIGLWRNAGHIDFATEAPEWGTMEGAHPELLPPH